jgi:hypothetical protein
MPHPPSRIVGSPGAATATTWLISLLILGLLAGLVASQRGNLAWDDADYLRRGLANARISESAGWVSMIPRVIGTLLHEHPKPPWLVAWIQVGALVLDRNSLDWLIIYAAVVPYALLLAASVYLGRRLAGPWGGLAALVCVVSSPYSLKFGGQVMVETFLSIWVLLIFALTCWLLEQPSRKRGMALGIVVGLALLTKLTTVLFVPIPLAFVLTRIVRGGPDRRVLLKSLSWSVVACTAVAAPWYAFNAGKAVKFAQFSSKYNVIAEGRAQSVSVARRLVLMTADLPGWPVAVTLTCASLYLVASVRRRGLRDENGPVGPKPTSLQARFSGMAWLGAGTAAAILLGPSYFDTRFLLPIWPVLAVDLGRRLSVSFPRLSLIPQFLLVAGLAAGVVNAASVVAQTPAITTYWNTTALIDDLVRKYGIHTLGNVGNCAEWNVCKTGLLNELRDQPADCFVLHDLSKLQTDLAKGHLAQFDAVVVLGRQLLPESKLQQAPGLNRSYGALTEVLAQDPRFFRVAVPQPGLPDLSVYIRHGTRGPTHQLSRKTVPKRR